MKHRTRSILSLLLALLLSFGLISCNSEPADTSVTTSGTNATIVNAPACTEHRWLDASCTNPKTCLACGGDYSLSRMSIGNVGKAAVKSLVGEKSHIVNKLDELGSCYGSVGKELCAEGLEVAKAVDVGYVLCEPHSFGNVGKS